MPGQAGSELAFEQGCSGLLCCVGADLLLEKLHMLVQCSITGKKITAIVTRTTALLPRGAPGFRRPTPLIDYISFYLQTCGNAVQV